MKRLLRLLTVFLACFGNAYSQQSAQLLADILEQKGVIAHDDRERIRAASTDDAVRLIASILQTKGLLTGADIAAIGVPPSANVVAQTSKPATTQVAPQPEAPAVTAVSRIPLRLYGTLLMNSFYNTSLNNNQDIPLFAGKQGSDLLGGDKNFGMTVRQSRVGMRYTGTRVGDAVLSGQVEIDFFGGQSVLSNGVGFDLLRLRLAYGRVDWKNVSLVAGQDWSIFAPLNPTSFAGYAIPDMSASGNLWIRTPQIRADIRHDWSDTTHLLFQLAAVDPNVGDNPATFSTVRTAGIGEKGRLPGAESRVAITEGANTFALSGHYGRGKNAGLLGNRIVQTSINSWGVAGDYTVAIGKRFNLTGEAYEGRALGLYSSASGESVLGTGTTGEHGVESRGGWAQAQFNWTKKWQTNLAYGLDSVNAHELPAGNRDKTQTYMGNVMYKWSPNLTLATEWRRFLTNFKNQNQFDEQGDHINLGIAFTF